MVLPLSNPTKSFWIEGAKSELRDYRSSEELPTEVDIVIVGSGYTGATAAYWLHRVRSAPILEQCVDQVVYRKWQNAVYAYVGSAGRVRRCYG
jgi:NADH dehydrogenase FAD-containing subunit